MVAERFCAHRVISGGQWQHNRPCALNSAKKAKTAAKKPAASKAKKAKASPTKIKKPVVKKLTQKKAKPVEKKQPLKKLPQQRKLLQKNPQLPRNLQSQNYLSHEHSVIDFCKTIVYFNQM
jgi:hypothetical protein